MMYDVSNETDQVVIESRIHNYMMYLMIYY